MLMYIFGFCYFLNSCQYFGEWFFQSYRANEVCHTSSPKHEHKTVSEEIVQLFWPFSGAHCRPTKCFSSVSYRIQALRYRWKRWLDSILWKKKGVIKRRKNPSSVTLWSSEVVKWSNARTDQSMMSQEVRVSNWFQRVWLRAHDHQYDVLRETITCFPFCGECPYLPFGIFPLTPPILTTTEQNVKLQSFLTVFFFRWRFG